MIKLLAKNQPDKRYYFCDDTDSVYVINAPLENSEKAFVDNLSDFLRKSLESDLLFDERDFDEMEELRDYAVTDSQFYERNDSLTKKVPLDDFLLYAPIEIVENYLDLIEDMINERDFYGIALFFTQVSKSYSFNENSMLVERRDELRKAFDNARFSYILDMSRVDRTNERIKKNGNVFLFGDNVDLSQAV